MVKITKIILQNMYKTQIDFTILINLNIVKKYQKINDGKIFIAHIEN